MMRRHAVCPACYSGHLHVTADDTATCVECHAETWISREIGRHLEPGETPTIGGGVLYVVAA